MNSQFEKGLATRKQVMGEDFVGNAFARATDFTRPIQEHITPRLGAMSGSARGWTSRPAA